MQSDKNKVIEEIKNAGVTTEQDVKDKLNKQELL